ncbi:tetratricopeptide repeat protein [Loigolactobacillus backii]|uniref:Uncharacterized protein n=1 Tax=Loigolactobacillus backii TaxID=375175 RepID=A0A192H3R9_9LACO|nr:tetratricopeptide repeat protein [Loigolactobacillus backii]ANK62867.1 hypothetical protein AYR53_08915 [Loigolactobacillus backii]ANK70125.1 hypothetical protein AYR56_08090 [Loigolactobacillus backii]MDA5387252.1 tetratricopeptide repeat protein [Loigolactobacillus backii]MDA5389789.1 tetratricopeptide repeat protein [Loigolactobacillus backii]PIO83479.1 hypothetical protein BSQ39_07850 [Loigolactobacillus backii]
MSYSEQMLTKLSSGQLDAANKAFIQALRRDDDETLFSLAENLYALGFLKQAKRTYLKLLKKYPDEDEIRTTLADIAISDGNNDEALTYLDAIKPDSPAYAESLLVAADMYQQQGLYEVSEQKLLTARRLFPDESVITFALAEFYFDSGEFHKAVIYYETLVAAGVTELSKVNIIQRLGVAYANTGEFERALEYLEQIPTEELDPDAAFQYGFVELQLKDYKKAIEVLSGLRDQDPQYTSLYPYLAEALEANQQLEEAMRVLQEGIGMDQYNEVLYNKAAHVALRLDDSKAGEKYLIQLLQIDPDNMAAKIELSNLYVKQQRDTDNVKLLAKAVDQGDVDPQAYWNLGVSYERLEAYKKARENYLLAYSTFKNEPNFLRQIINFFREEGLRDETLAALQRYVKLVPTDDDMALLLEEYRQE